MHSNYGCSGQLEDHLSTLTSVLLRGILQIVAIANDITYSSGSFGPKEDAVFRAATDYALEEKLPLVYLAANSGARVGLANEVKQCLRVSARCSLSCVPHSRTWQQ